MSPRTFLAGFAKSVLVHRHAFVPSPARTLEIGRTARLPDSFDEAYGPAEAEAALAAAVKRLWLAPGVRARPGVLEGLIDRCAAPAGVRALERIVRDFPDYPALRLWPALARLRRNDLPAAWRELDALVSARPDWAWALIVRSELGRVDIVYDRALKDLDRAERLEPRNAWVHAFRARVLFQKNPGAEAISAMDRAVALAPKSGWVRAWRADSRRKLGDLRGAAADLAAAARLEPGYDRISLWQGKVLRAQGKPREAERALTRGLRICPHFEKAFAER
ncbi:MAG TPA: tetratricopeptide repeat protein, partial [Elusimicrobiota bacterium]|nr:tetratricopeptide repeat protein [Elusimicrobiota bacterium]